MIPSTVAPYIVRRTTTKQDLVEGAPEVPHGACVDDRVHAGIDVAEPREHRKHNVRMRDTGVSAYGKQEVRDEERHPADTEYTHDDTKRLRRFLFLR